MGLAGLLVLEVEWLFMYEGCVFHLAPTQDRIIYLQGARPMPRADHTTLTLPLHWTAGVSRIHGV